VPSQQAFTQPLQQQHVPEHAAAAAKEHATSKHANQL
jgi:hypothetical protein